MADKHDKAKRREARDRRLQAALRENLKRRKQQVRVRGSAPNADPADPVRDCPTDPGTGRRRED